jgi:transcriptional regulator
MYDIKYFKESDPGLIIDFMKANPFIILTGTDAEHKPVATHIPVLIEERDGKIFLQAHVMRKQDHTNGFEMSPNVLAIFNGAQAYISANWYETKQVASTWNYQAVHARGVLRFLNDEALYDLLVKLTAHFENNPDSPAQVKHMSEDYIRSNMKAIIAFEIEVTDLQHVFKLSQNRDKQSFENITDQLKDGDANAKKLADEMLLRKSQIFKP